MRRFGFIGAVLAIGALIGGILVGGGGAGGPIYREFILTNGGAWPSTTSGAGSPSKVEYTTNKTDYYHVSFDTGESVQWTAELPVSYRDGTPIYVAVKWTATAGSGGQSLQWNFAAKAMGDNESLDGSWGSGVNIDDTFQTAHYQHITAESAAYTIENSAQRGDTIQMRLKLNSESITGLVRGILVRVKFTGE